MPAVRPHLEDLVRIESAEIRGDFVRLDRNERVSALPDDVWRDMVSSMDPRAFSSYADPKPLIEAFAAANGLPADHVVATNGSDAAIRRAFQAFVAPGDTVVMSAPTYTMYAIYTRIAQARAMPLPYRDDRTLAKARWLDAIAQGARLVCLVNPDNPTGAVLPQADVREIVAAAAGRDVLCLVDEAYYPCHPETAIDAVRTYPNLIVTRSLSKAYGLGGLRIGFACAQPALIAGLGKVRGLHEVNSVAVHAGCYLLSRPALVRRFVVELEAGRERIVRCARRHGFGVPPCPTNYQLIELPDDLDLAAVAGELTRLGFLVRGPFREPCLRRCLRVTLDGPELMDRFVAAFDAALATQVATATRADAASGRAS